MTSVRRGNRHIVAVVLGGASAGSRDARMRSLIEEHIGQAATQRGAPRGSRNGRTRRRQRERRPRPPRPRPHRPCRRARTTCGRRRSAGAPGHSPPRAPMTMRPTHRPRRRPYPPRHRTASRPARPIRSARSAVKTLTVRAGAVQDRRALRPIDRKPGDAGPRTQSPARELATYPPNGAPRRQRPPKPRHPRRLRSPNPACSAPCRARDAVASTDPVALGARLLDRPPGAGSRDPPQRLGHSDRRVSRGRRGEGTSEIGAGALAKRLLERADPFTERVVKGDITLYRARFAGLDEGRAEAACKHLKRNKIDSFAVKNPIEAVRAWSDPQGMIPKNWDPVFRTRSCAKQRDQEQDRIQK